MQLGYALVGSLVALGFVALFARVRVELDLRAVGLPNGHWLAAFGVATGPFALAGAAAKNADTRLELHCFGRRVNLGGRPVSDDAVPPSGVPPRRSGGSGGASRVWQRFRRWFSLEDAWTLFARIGRAVFVEELPIFVRYGFSDVALTGKIAGTLYALSAVLPARVPLTHEATWGGEESWEMTLKGRVALWPGLVLMSVVWYILRRARPRRAEVPA